MECLKDSHYAPIDIAIMHSIISLVVQEYFCYRIWTLNRRLSWFCIVIAIVRSLFFPFPSKNHHDLAWVQSGVIQSIGAAWGGSRVSNAPLYLVSIFDRDLVSHSWKVCCLKASTICTHLLSLRIIISADILLLQLWSLPSAFADILIAIAMTVLVRGRPLLRFNMSIGNLI